MILSASGWRKVFAVSGNEEDKTTEIGTTNTYLCALIAETFAEYIKDRTQKPHPVVAVGTDSRPTGKKIAEVINRVLIGYEINVRFLGISSAPEIMAYARGTDGFLYISASHNPVGHNGIKFGLNDGGVLPGSETNKLVENFKNKCAAEDSETHAQEIMQNLDESKLNLMLSHTDYFKKEAVKAYDKFIREVITGTDDAEEQETVFEIIRQSLKSNPLTVVCDMNGSSRNLSIDKNFFPSLGINFLPFNTDVNEIPHAIIPEPENLVYCAERMNELRSEGNTSIQLGYMPDCDGDRGNIVFWNEKTNTAEPIAAQKVFALSVLAESAFSYWLDQTDSEKQNNSEVQKKYAVAVNCPTSMRIEEIASAFGSKVFRAEVGEANVVNLAREKREEGYTVRILGEGSNGGNITHPSSVRDPIATVFALVKLLSIRDITENDGSIKKGLFHLWCEKSGQSEKYRNDFTLSDIIETLPVYTTTGVSEERAVLHVKSEDKGKLKENFKKCFEESWNLNKDQLKKLYGFDSYDAVLTNGTKEVIAPQDSTWNNANGGLKIRFFDSNRKTVAFIWMRPSGTEPVFRVMCDVKGKMPLAEKSLLAWETMLIQKSDC